jgi:hypothetical protein
MSNETIGYLGYKLYCAGWRQALHRHNSPIEHGLLSVFFYYRRGFAEGSAWIRASQLSEKVFP